MHQPNYIDEKIVYNSDDNALELGRLSKQIWSFWPQKIF